MVLQCIRIVVSQLVRPTLQVGRTKIFPYRQCATLYGEVSTEFELSKMTMRYLKAVPAIVRLSFDEFVILSTAVDC